MSFIVLSCAPTLVAPVNPFIGSYTGTLSGTNAGIQFEVPMDAVLSGSGTGVSGSWSTPSDSGQLSASSTSSTQLSALVFSARGGESL